MQHGAAVKTHASKWAIVDDDDKNSVLVNLTPTLPPPPPRTHASKPSAAQLSPAAACVLEAAVTIIDLRRASVRERKARSRANQTAAKREAEKISARERQARSRTNPANECKKFSVKIENGVFGGGGSGSGGGGSGSGLESGGGSRRSKRGKTIAHLGRLQEEQPAKEDDPPLMGGSITADKPSPITKGSKCQNSELAADEVDVAKNTKPGTHALAVTSSNASGDAAVSQKEGDDGANTDMADAASDGCDDDSVSSTTQSYYKDLCEKLTAILVQRKVADRAARIESKRLKRDVAELKRRRLSCCPSWRNKVLPTSGGSNEGHI